MASPARERRRYFSRSRTSSMSDSTFTASQAVDLLKRQGRRVVKTDSCWWYNAYGQDSVYYSFPPNRIISPSPQEIDSVFEQVPTAKAVRYLEPPNGRGRESYIWKCTRPFDLTTVYPKARNQVRQGLRNCEIKPLTLCELERI